MLLSSPGSPHIGAPLSHPPPVPLHRLCRILCVPEEPSSASPSPMYLIEAIRRLFPGVVLVPIDQTVGPSLTRLLPPDRTTGVAMYVAQDALTSTFKSLVAHKGQLQIRLRDAAGAVAVGSISDDECQYVGLARGWSCGSASALATAPVLGLAPSLVRLDPASQPKPEPREGEVRAHRDPWGGGDRRRDGNGTTLLFPSTSCLTPTATATATAALPGHHHRVPRPVGARQCTLPSPSLREFLAAIPFRMAAPFTRATHRGPIVLPAPTRRAPAPARRSVPPAAVNGRKRGPAPATRARATTPAVPGGKTTPMDDVAVAEVLVAGGSGATALAQLTLPKLKAYLRANKLLVSGPKPTVVARILAHLGPNDADAMGK